ncbi:MAG: hypothetical protein WA354_17990 [Terracidiphilus sp.]
MRALLLFVLYRHIETGTYSPLYSGLWLAEILLGTFVAVELIRRLNRGIGGLTGRQSLLMLTTLCAACGLTWITLSMLPAGVRADRIQVLAWFVMLALFGVIVKSSRHSNLIRISAGLAIFSLIQLLTLAGRTRAFMNRNEGAYVAWSYVPAGGYLAVVMLWLAVLQEESERTPSKSARAK